MFTVMRLWTFADILLTIDRFLCELGLYEELHEMLDVAFAAYEKLAPQEQDTLILADLERHRSTEWLQRGDFQLSDMHMKKSIDLYEHCPVQFPTLFLAPYNHMANVAASANRYSESLQWQAKVESVSVQLVEDAMKRTALTNCNTGRALWLIGRTPEAKERLEKAIEQYKSSENWAMLC